MVEARLQRELAETKAELQRLRERVSVWERVSVGTPAVHKELSLMLLLPKCSGSESGIPLEEFISNIEGPASVGLWEDSDRPQVAILRLSDASKQFYNGFLELHSQGFTWQIFKEVFRRRFRDIHTDQHHFMRFQTAWQSRNESPLDFAERCRAFSQKLVYKTDDPVAQRVHYENAERKLLTSFVTGLIVTPGRQVRYASTLNVDQALKIALSVQQAEKQEMFSESFYASFDNSFRQHSPSSSHRASHGSRGSAEEKYTAN